MSRSDLDLLIGTRLKNLRWERGLSMSAPGRGMGTIYQEGRKNEAGDNRVSAASLYRLAQLLNVEIEELFRELPDPSVCSASDVASDVGEASLDRTLGRIEDLEVRRHLGSLLQALGSAR